MAVLERAAARSPLDPFAHGFLAERLWEAAARGKHSTGRKRPSGTNRVTTGRGM